MSDTGDMPPRLTLGEIEHTERGFEIIRFQDYYGEHVKLQQSSIAVFEQPGSSAIWLGSNEQAMHLSYEQVMALVNHLECWIKTGSFTTAILS